MKTALNGICPYFTMFPLAFPEGILKRHAAKGDTVLDPFLGTGTTTLAGSVFLSDDNNFLTSSFESRKLIA